MESPYNKIYTDICDFNHLVEQIRAFVKDLKEIIFFGGVFMAPKFSSAISEKLFEYSTKIFKDDVSMQLAKKYYNEYKF